MEAGEQLDRRLWKTLFSQQFRRFHRINLCQNEIFTLRNQKQFFYILIHNEAPHNSSIEFRGQVCTCYQKSNILAAFSWKVIEAIFSTRQGCCVKFPGTIGILKATARTRSRLGCGNCNKLFFLRNYACLCVSHLYRVCTGGDVADHKPTAPLPWSICFAGVHEQPIVDLRQGFIRQFKRMDPSRVETRTEIIELTDICPASRGQSTALSAWTSSSGISWLTDSMFPGRTAWRWGSIPALWVPTSQKYMFTLRWSQ